MGRNNTLGELETRKKGSLGWVKLIGGAFLLIVGFALLLKLAGFLIKWAIVLLLVYGAYRLLRYMLADNFSDAQETVLQIEDERDEVVLDDLDRELELEALKIELEREASSDP